MTLPSGKTISREEFEALLGKEMGVSDWFTIDQSRIDQFADCTEDHQFIHVDPEAAAKTPFGSTIAHGFLTLSMLSAMVYQMPSIEGVVMGVNYGFEKVRFVSPVKVGARIRARFVLAAFDEIRPGEFQSMMDVTVEIEGQEKPALVAQWLGRRYFGEKA
ncbi:putative enoyl-CoA hydratase 1 [Thalassovita gelatinovora]|uniref:Putative enoyl-CoA hydratase 1 n=1 Tax=Thalassovita gelatinovora TaxID=53501 RepID=A0A0P1FB64_THAGE|nr:MaoC family dehydratase [Thalassovita gelatinovora]QIZ80762.1 MaoC family dehydratase [Thalassovita gelatinovora]CUH65417.1 putative enoyl-CoA hydratase 1 [Thalassovita gelatinovora]SEQ90749.1 Acyl dehydratase [Thalassovita gelatinovora]